MKFFKQADHLPGPGRPLSSIFSSWFSREPGLTNTKVDPALSELHQPKAAENMVPGLEGGLVAPKVNDVPSQVERVGRIFNQGEISTGL